MVHLSGWAVPSGCVSSVSISLLRSQELAEHKTTARLPAPSTALQRPGRMALGTPRQPYRAQTGEAKGPRCPAWGQTLSQIPACHLHLPLVSVGRGLSLVTPHLSPAWSLGVVSLPHQAERVTWDERASGALRACLLSVKWVGNACLPGLLGGEAEEGSVCPIKTLVRIASWR